MIIAILNFCAAQNYCNINSELSSASTVVDNKDFVRLNWHKIPLIKEREKLTMKDFNIVKYDFTKTTSSAGREGTCYNSKCSNKPQPKNKPPPRISLRGELFEGFMNLFLSIVHLTPNKLVLTDFTINSTNNQPLDVGKQLILIKEDRYALPSNKSPL